MGPAFFLTAILLAAPRHPVGVISVGPAPAAARLQEELEEAVRGGRDLDLVGGAEVAVRLRAEGEGPAGPTVASHSAFAADLEQAKAAYYEGVHAVALDRLAALLGEINRSGALITAADAVELRLWRIEVFLALDDDLSAEAEATEALRIDPAFQVDLREFKPSVARVVEVARKKLGPAATLSLKGLPAGARVAIDGVVTESATIKVYPGHHRLDLWIAGARPWSHDLEVATDPEISLQPAPVPNLPPEVAALARSIEVGNLDSSGRKLLQELAARLGVQVLLLAATDGYDLRAIALSATTRDLLFSREVPLDGATEELVGWSRAASAQLARPSGLDEPLVQGPGPERGFYLVGAAGLAVPQGSGISTDLGDSGGSLEMDLGLRPWSAFALELGGRASYLPLGPGAGGRAGVIEPFLGGRWSPIRIGPTEASLRLVFSPWSLLNLGSPVPVDSGGTSDNFRGVTVEMGGGFRRPVGPQMFVSGDLRYLWTRYYWAGSSPLHVPLSGDEVVALLGVGWQL